MVTGPAEVLLLVCGRPLLLSDSAVVLWASLSLLVVDPGSVSSLCPVGVRDFAADSGVGCGAERSESEGSGVSRRSSKEGGLGSEVTLGVG